MIITLNVLQVILEIILGISIIGILIIGADYVYFEIAEMVKRDRVWLEIARHLIQNGHVESTHVDKLIEDSEEELRKTKLRAEKEDEAWMGFFGEGYFRGFDEQGRLIYRGATAPMEPDWDFFTKVDAIVDNQIFTNTEEL